MKSSLPLLTAAKMQIEESGYLSSLIGKLRLLVDKLDEEESKSSFDLAKALFLAEFINSEFDSYLATFDNIAGFREWTISGEFKQRWHYLKNWRDQVYDKLIAVQHKFGAEAVSDQLNKYKQVITGYAFPEGL